MITFIKFYAEIGDGVEIKYNSQQKISYRCSTWYGGLMHDMNIELHLHLSLISMHQVCNCNWMGGVSKRKIMFKYGLLSTCLNM